MNFSGKIVKIEEDPLSSEQKRLKKRKLTDRRDKSYPCGKCDYVANQLCHLKTHIKSKHEGVRYPCFHCEFTATEPSSLTRHIKSKHEGVRYPCYHCEYAATQACVEETH